MCFQADPLSLPLTAVSFTGLIMSLSAAALPLYLTLDLSLLFFFFPPSL